MGVLIYLYRFKTLLRRIVPNRPRQPFVYPIPVHFANTVQGLVTAGSSWGRSGRLSSYGTDSLVIIIACADLPDELVTSLHSVVILKFATLLHAARRAMAVAAFLTHMIRP